VIVGWIEGRPCRIHPVDRFPIKGLGGETVNVELSARFESSHCDSKGEVECGLDETSGREKCGEKQVG
jgi:hypothetical protein